MTNELDKDIYDLDKDIYDLDNDIYDLDNDIYDLDYKNDLYYKNKKISENCNDFDYPFLKLDKENILISLQIYFITHI